MENNELRKTLITHLDTLKRNLDVVPLEVLKTKYKKPFDKLCQDISGTATAYVKQVTLTDIRIQIGFQDEAIPLIQNTILQSGLLRQISAAAFRRQDIVEIDKLALELKQQIQTALQPFYEKHLGLYLSAECFADPPKLPELYCEATGCIQRDGVWVPLESKDDSLLLFLRAKKENAA